MKAYGQDGLGTSATSTYESWFDGRNRGYYYKPDHSAGTRIGGEAVVAYTEHDPVNHPAHYTWLPGGIEVIQITEHLNFCLGNAVKYILRSGHKNDRVEDLRKAVWYLNREIERIEKDSRA